MYGQRISIPIMITYNPQTNLRDKVGQLEQTYEGIKVTHVFEAIDLISADIPLEKLIDIAKDKDIKYIRSPREVEALRN
jgi:hypothetical protein